MIFHSSIKVFVTPVFIWMMHWTLLIKEYYQQHREIIKGLEDMFLRFLMLYQEYQEAIDLLQRDLQQKIKLQLCLQVCQVLSEMVTSLGLHLYQSIKELLILINIIRC